MRGRATLNSEGDQRAAYARLLFGGGKPTPRTGDPERDVYAPYHPDEVRALFLLATGGVKKSNRS